MSWKHFWLNNPERGQESYCSYCINSYGALNNIIVHSTKERRTYENVWLTCDEIEKILSLKTKQEKYNLCDKLFKEKFLQPKEKQKELSKDEQSKLEKLFS